MSLLNNGLDMSGGLKRADYWLGTAISILVLAGIYCLARNKVIKKDNGSDNVEKD